MHELGACRVKRPHSEAGDEDTGSEEDAPVKGKTKGKGKAGGRGTQTKSGDAAKAAASDKKRVLISKRGGKKAAPPVKGKRKARVRHTHQEANFVTESNSASANVRVLGSGAAAAPVDCVSARLALPCMVARVR